MSEWFKDESFWNGLYPFMFSERKFEMAEDEVRGILALASLGVCPIFVVGWTQGKECGLQWEGLD